ncbi:MAG: hypothetical protein AAGF12_23460 [Myxococcota bacterium]
MRLGFLLFVLASCSDESLTSDAGREASAEAGERETASNLDLLLVLDTSSDAEELQRRFFGELSPFLRGLLAGDHDHDGVAEARPLQSVQVAAISMEAGGAEGFRDCDGDGGAFLEPIEGTGCRGDDPAFQSLREVDDVARAFEALRCVGERIDGCGVEQPLEAATMALEANAGGPFLREGAALAVLFLTKEDDCSLLDSSLLVDDDGPYAATPFEHRCASHPEALHTPRRFVDALVRGRALPRIALAVFAGIPPERETVRPAELLRTGELEPVLDPTGPSGMESVCVDPSIGAVFPASRLIDAAGRFQNRGGRAIGASVCGDAGSYRASLRRFAQEIAAATAAPAE